MKTLKILSIILSISFIFNGCNDEEFFELQRPPEDPWLTPAEYERAAVSPYHYAFYSSWGGGWYMVDRVVFDIMTDIVYRIPGAGADYPIDEVYERSTSLELGRNNDSFRDGYRGIAVCNSGLDFYYAANREPFPDASNAEKQNVHRIAGELHFMRALAYFNHTVRNCPVPGNPAYNSLEILPYRTSVSDIDAALNPEFVVTDTIYNLVIDDLKAAKKLLPWQYTDIYHPSYQYGRANRFAAHAILARVYMRIGEYDLALAETDTVLMMSEGYYNLSQDPIEVFNRSEPSIGEEVIFYALYYDEDLNNTPKDFTLLTLLDYRTINGGHGEDFKRGFWHAFCMSYPVAMQIGWMEEDYSETEAALRDKRYQQLYHRFEGYDIEANDDETFEQKYPALTTPRLWCDKYYRAPDGRFGNVPVIRLAELYLNRAILRYNNGNLQGAADDINVIRKRAWDQAVAGVVYEESDDFITAANITEEIIENERLKELMFEGDGLLYLQGLDKPIPPGEREVDAVPEPYPDFYWPVPQSELDFSGE